MLIAGGITLVLMLLMIVMFFTGQVQ
jgi:hypothetical protein